jgi:outer membrane protein
MSKLFIGITTALALLFSMTLYPVTAASAEEVKIGVFDLQRAINLSKKGQAAKAKLVKKYERIQKELQNREASIEKMRKDLERQASMMSPESKYEKEKDLRNKIRDFQDMYNDYTQEMKKEEVEITKPVIEGLLKKASALGRERGYTVVLEIQRAGVLWIPKEHDLTEEVVKLYDSGK